MKTAEQMLRETIVSHPISKGNVEMQDFESEGWDEILPVLEIAMKRYAHQACEDLKERIYQESLLIEKPWIRNADIILP